MWAVYYYFMDRCRSDKKYKELWAEELRINTELSIRLGKYIKLCNQLKKLD